jgi:hypothetical protein
LCLDTCSRRAAKAPGWASLEVPNVVNNPTLEELERQYAEPEVRMSIFRLLNIVILLSESIIEKGYRVPPALHDSLKLTETGQQVYELLRKRHVPYPEARLLCFLEFNYGDILVDPVNTDQDAIITEVSKEIVDRSLLYPCNVGRLLYDKYFELYGEEGRSSLSVQETQRLLKDTPQGVYQVFDIITGPYGILRSQSFRSLLPDRDIPSRHCPDPSCSVVHSVHLSSDQEAEINRYHEARRKVREAQSANERPWSEFISDITASLMPIYKDWALDPVILLINEALADDELQKLFGWLLDNSDGILREASQRAGFTLTSGSPNSALARAQIMQLILVCNDKDIVKGLDALTRNGTIQVHAGEIRTPVIRRHTRFGRHRMYAELGSFGVRVRTSRENVAPLRARRLVESMYRMDDAGDRQELEWQLREETSDTVESKLENYLQTRPLRKSLGSLILARKSNVVVATEVLGLDENGYDSDEDLLSAALWKLGFTIDDRSEPHATFWQLHNRMLQQARRSISGASSTDRAEIRSLAGSYFVELEHILDDSLAYTTWALTNDHFMSPKPFVYRPALDRLRSMEILTQRKTDDKNLRLIYGDKNNLFPLAHGYDRLRVRLEEYEDGSEQFERSKNDLPDWVSVQNLEKFPFMHTVPFLDLLLESSGGIKRILEGITSQLKGADISDTRAEWLHDRRSMASLDRLREALESIGGAVRTIEENGFARQLYVRTKDDLDGDGRRTVVLANATGREISFFRPSSFAWLRLPSLAVAQYVMNAARFADPSEALRFTAEVDSPYSKIWEDFPRRPRLDRGRSVLGGPGLSVEV